MFSTKSWLTFTKLQLKRLINHKFKSLNTNFERKKLYRLGYPLIMPVPDYTKISDSRVIES